MYQPLGFIDKIKLDHVCFLKHSLYGLKQAPRTWNIRFATFFVALVSNKVFPIHRCLCYAPELILNIFFFMLMISSLRPLLPACCSALSHVWIRSLKCPIKAFSTTFSALQSSAMSLVFSFININTRLRFSIEQTCHIATHVSLPSTQNKNSQSIPVRRALILLCIGALLVLSSTWLSLDPTLPLPFSRCVSSCTIHEKLTSTHSNGFFATWKAPFRMAFIWFEQSLCTLLHTLTLTGRVFLLHVDLPLATMSSSVITWSHGHQNGNKLFFGTEAEYRGFANVVSDATWLCNLLFEMKISLARATLVYCDNVNAMYLSSNPVQH